MGQHNAWIKMRRTTVNVASYTLLYSDVLVSVTYTATGACGIALPAITAMLADKIFIINDAGYNASVNNITVTPSGAQKVANINAPVVMNTNGAILRLSANFNTQNWEYI